MLYRKHNFHAFMYHGISYRGRKIRAAGSSPVRPYEKSLILMKEYGSKAVQLSMVEKKELIGGFVIRTGDREYDRSILGRYKSLRQKLVMR